MSSLNDPLLKDATVAAAFGPAHDVATLKTYRYLRLGMLAGVAALGFSIMEEERQKSIHCLIGSISGYYYTPVRPVFIGVMVTIGVALIAIKGRTVAEDVFLSFAGMMAPIVAFVPTNDDVKGVCRQAMFAAHHYQPDAHTGYFPASTNNNLHALVFAGYVAIGLAVLAYLIQLAFGASRTEYTTGTWITLGIGFAVVVTASIMLRWHYALFKEGHATAASLMFLLLGLAAVANSVHVFMNASMNKLYAWIYGVVGIAMIVAGALFVIQYRTDRSILHGHLVLTIEVIEIGLFVVFWATQTVERWNHTV